MSNEFSLFKNSFNEPTKERLFDVCKIMNDCLPNAYEKIAYGVPTIYNKNGS